MKLSKRKKRKEDVKEQHIITCNMPNEMAMEILRRVPCQDLLENLKLVCKKWYSIIYNGSFAYSHFEHITRKPSSFSQLKALLISITDGKSVTVSSLEWHNNFKDHPFENLKSNPKDLFTIEYALGTRIDLMSFQKANCVNSFVCFWSTHHAHFHICNSMTMEYVTTPPNPYWSSSRDDHTIVGLGFCPISYQYKVIIFQHQYGLDIGEPKKIKGSISTINGNDQSWKPLNWNDLSFGPGGRSTACVNGVLYWCTESLHYDSYQYEVKYDTIVLIAFDIAKEESSLNEVPIESLEQSVSIEEKGGKLCLMINEMCHNSSCILFKGYIAPNNDDLESLNSWILEFSVTIHDIYGLRGEYHVSFTNEILMVDTEEEIGFYDVATGMILDQFRRSTLTTSILVPYVPSLISLHHRPIREKNYLDVVCG